MRVLVGCEISGIVRRAFLERGHDAWSIDLKPAVDRSNRHIIGDIRDYLTEEWDLLAVMHPPCTRLCNSGVRWLSSPPTKLDSDAYTAEQAEAFEQMSVEERLRFMWSELQKGAALFSDCWNAPIPRKCLENPVMHRHAKVLIRNFRKAAQTVQPHWFGDPFFKATGLYLEGLPLLRPTKRLIVPAKGTDEYKSWSRVHRASPGRDRGQQRSEFFPGLARAMADQWGNEKREPVQLELVAA